MDGNRCAVIRPHDLSSTGISPDRLRGLGNLEMHSWKRTQYRFVWSVCAGSFIDDSAVCIAAVDRIFGNCRISDYPALADGCSLGSLLVRAFPLDTLVVDVRRNRTRGFSRRLSPSVLRRST